MLAPSRDIKEDSHVQEIDLVDLTSVSARQGQSVVGGTGPVGATASVHRPPSNHLSWHRFSGSTYQPGAAV